MTDAPNTKAETEAALADLFRDPLPPEWSKSDLLALRDQDAPEWCEAHTPAAIAEAGAPRFGEWYPIETAPKDGTAILVRGRHDNMWVEHIFASESFCCGDDPTHWTHLPDPPPVRP